ncbi:MAG: aquaporin [Hyphomicrobiales bacterium]
MRAFAAEFIGAFAWVAAVCGTALVAGDDTVNTTSILMTSLAIGFVVAAMTAALSAVSGAHFNPVVSIASFVTGRMKTGKLVSYVSAQVLGAILAALVFFLALSSTDGYQPIDFGANGYGSRSPGGFSLYAVGFIEMALTTLYGFIVLTMNTERNNAIWRAVVIGGALAAFHMMSLPVDKSALNPARSTAMALFAEGWAVDQLWLFWAAPVCGAILAGVLVRWLKPHKI